MIVALLELIPVGLRSRKHHIGATQLHLGLSIG